MLLVLPQLKYTELENFKQKTKNCTQSLSQIPIPIQMSFIGMAYIWLVVGINFITWSHIFFDFLKLL